MSIDNDHNQESWPTESEVDENRSQMSWHSSHEGNDGFFAREGNESGSGGVESGQYAGRLDSRHSTGNLDQESVEHNSYYSYDGSTPSNSFRSHDRSTSRHSRASEINENLNYDQESYGSRSLEEDAYSEESHLPSIEGSAGIQQMPASRDGSEKESASFDQISSEPKNELSHSIDGVSKKSMSSEGNSTGDRFSDREDEYVDQVSADLSRGTMSHDGDAGSVRDVASEGGTSGDRFSNQAGSTSRSRASDSHRSHRSSSSRSRSANGSRASYSSKRGSSKHSSEHEDFDQVSTFSRTEKCPSIAEDSILNVSEENASGKNLLDHDSNNSSRRSQHRSENDDVIFNGSKSSSSSNGHSSEPSGDDAGLDQRNRKAHSGDDDKDSFASRNVWSQNSDDASRREISFEERVSGDKLSHGAESTGRSNSSDSFSSQHIYENGSRSVNDSQIASIDNIAESGDVENAIFDEVSAESRHALSMDGDEASKEVASLGENISKDRQSSHCESVDSSRRSQRTSTDSSAPSISSSKHSENAYSGQLSRNALSHSVDEDSRRNVSSEGNISGDRLSHHAASASRSNSNLSLGQSESRSVAGNRSLDGSKSSLSRHGFSSVRSGNADFIDVPTDSGSVQSYTAEEDARAEDFHQENQLGDRLPHHAGSSRRSNSSASSQSGIRSGDGNKYVRSARASMSNHEIRSSERLSKDQDSLSTNEDLRRKGNLAGRSERSGMNEVPQNSSSSGEQMESKLFVNEFHSRENASESNMPQDHFSHGSNEHASRNGSRPASGFESASPSQEHMSRGEKDMASNDNPHASNARSQPSLEGNVSENGNESRHTPFQEGKELDDGSRNKAFSVISTASGHSKPLIISFDSDDDLSASELGDEFELLAAGARINGNGSKAPTEDPSRESHNNFSEPQSIAYEVQDALNAKALPEQDISCAPSEEESFGIEELMGDNRKNELQGIQEEGNKELNEQSSDSREKNRVETDKENKIGLSDGSTSDIEANQNDKDGEYNTNERGVYFDDSAGSKESNDRTEPEVTSVLSNIDEEEGIKVPLLSDDDDLTHKSQNTSKSSDESALDSSFISRNSISQRSQLAFTFKEGGIAEEENKLPESILSFLISSSARRAPYIIAMLVLLFKFAVLVMLIANLTGKKVLASGQNLLGVPISSSWPVASCQVLALIIAVLAQDDLLNGLTLLRAGSFSNARLLVDEQASKRSEASEMAFNGVSKCRWSAAILVQCFVGLATLVSTFLLVVTSPDVTSILLTFSIVTFISKLDNGLFVLAKNGLLGDSITEEARTITSTRYTLPISGKQSFFRSFMPAFVVLFFLLLMLGGWAYIFYQQSNGSYWPQVIVLQLDDTYGADLGYVSGLYELQSSPLRYEKGAARIMFCESKRSWTVRVEGEDPCRSVIAMSSPQEGMIDIMASAKNDWFAPSEHRSNSPMVSIQNIFLAEPCLSDEDCGGPERGECQKTGCTCRSDFYGVNCGFESNKTCSILEVDEQTSTFRSTRTLSSYYEILQKDGTIIQANQHPVFIGNNSKNNLDVMIFSGLRWTITSANDLVGNDNDPVLALVLFFSGSAFDATKHLRVVDQRSAPVRFNTPSDRSTPVGLPWAPVDTTSSVLLSTPETRVICKGCNYENKCLNGGICIDGTCQCRNRAKGDLCQIPPIGDGYCDHPFFNTALYDFDGGDCCATTCSSSNVHACGQVSLSDRPEESFVGFPFCRNPAAQGCAGSSICWSSTGNDISYLSGGQGSFLTLSANGKIVVVSEPSLDTVRIFDQIAEKWVLRGQALKSNLQVDFGSKVAISTPPGNVYLQRVGRIPVTLAASMKGNLPALRVYQWGALDADWSQVCSDIVINCDGNDCEIREISLGREGERGILATALKNGEVYVYQVSFDIGECTLQWATTGTSLHVSGNAERLAVAAPKYSNYLDSDSMAIFDVSAKSTPDLQMEYSNNNLLSKTYREPLQSRIFSFAFSHDGRTMNIARISSDSSVTIDTLRQNDLYQSIASALSADQLSTLEIEGGISIVRFSIDGNALGVKSDDNLIYVANYAENSIPLWTMSSTPFLSSELGFDFDISSKGMIASAEGDMVETVGLSEVCGEDESSILISLKLDDSPEDISWYLEQVGVDGELTFSNTTLLWCQECYDEAFAGTIVLETLCVPKRIINCIRLTFRSGKRRFTDTITAFADGLDFVSYNGEVGEFAFLPADTYSFSQDCRVASIDDNVNRQCFGGEKVLVASITTNLNPQETEWKIETLNDEEVSKGGSYDTPLKTFSETACVRPAATCYVFTISGYNNVELFLKDQDGGYETIDNFSGSFPSDQQQEIYFGVGCPSMSGPTKAPLGSVFSIQPTPSGLQTRQPSSPVTNPSPVSVPSTTQVPAIVPSRNPASVSSPTNQEPIFIISPLTPYPTTAPTASIKEIEISIMITLGDEPEETGWTLSDNTNQNIVAEVTAGTYMTPNTKEGESIVIETGKSYLFCVTVAGRDGIRRFSVNYKGWPLVIDNGQFESERCHEIKVAPGEVTDIIRSFGEK